MPLSTLFRPARFAALPLLALFAATPAFAQPAPAATTAPPAKPRFVLQIPAGFQKVTAGTHSALCEPGDVEWVTKALTTAKPTTRPTTMPTDLLKRATSARSAILARMKTDLALADEKSPADFYDNKFLPALRKFDELRPPVYFLVITHARLDELAKAGWGEPRFHFNRVAGSTSYDDNVMLSVDKPMDDAVLPAFINAKDTPEERIKKLTAGVSELETKLAQIISGQSQLQVFNLFAQYIGETHIEPLKLKRDQIWFGMGIAAYLTAGYAAEVTGITKPLWLQDATFEGPRVMLSARTIDLLRPVEEAKMKAAAGPVYTQAMRRKAVAVVMNWTAKAGDTAIPKTLTALRNTPPADGLALVKLIQDTTGMDLTTDLTLK